MKAWSCWIGGVLVALCAACTASGGGGGGGSTASQDATDAAGSADTAVVDSGTGSGDIQAGDAAIQSGDAGSKEVTTATDAATPADSAATTDANAGGGDTGPVATDAGPGPIDGGPVPVDAGPAPSDGGSKPGDGGPVGPATCETVCKNIAKANCPNEDPYDKCMTGCQGFLDAGSKCPPEKVQAFLACASDNTITCKASGKSEAPAACEAIMKELVDCMSGGGPDPPPPPDPCKMGTCYAGAMDPNNPSGKPQCGCSSTCNGNSVAIDCDGNQCFCTLNGQKQAGFEQGTTCSNPQEAMSAICGKP